MSRHNNHNRGISLRLRQLGAEQIVLPIGDGLSISWLTFQVILFFIACVICSCCSISSYAWDSVSASLLTPRPTQTVPLTPAATDAELDESQLPTATPIKPYAPIRTRCPVETATPVTPTQTSTPEATSQSLTFTPTPVPTPTSPPRPTPTGALGPSASSPSLRIAHVEYNPAGDEPDEEHVIDLDQELVTIENPGTGDQDMSGWTLNNDRLDTYRFPDGFILCSETSVRVWTKSGTDTGVDLYWGSEKEMWDNERGVAYLRDHTGALIDALDWQTRQI